MVCILNELTNSLGKLRALRIDNCGFKHHFVWRNGGKHESPCPLSVRDANLLCAHSSLPILSEALLLVRSYGSVTEAVFNEWRAIVPANSLLKAEMRLFNLGTVVTNRDQNTGACPSWINGVAVENNAPKPAQELTTGDVESLAFSDQLDAGAARIELRDILVELIESNLRLKDVIKE